MISSTNGRGKTIPFRKKTEVKIKKQPGKAKLKFKFPFIVMTLVVIYMAVSLAGEMQKLNVMRQNVQAIEQQVEQLQNKNAELHKTLELMQSKDYVERVARENLGLVKPGESLIVPVEQPEQPSANTNIIDPTIKD
ncbi:septum formation initiator family protein [Peptococcaceae bacterium 1198_IL3148]